MDYTEIDGASNNSVDNVRSLIESVQYLPARGKHKVYVIDEVHMLSVSAFNALLKTLEEPPVHAIFILATTDPQKLLGTVISRCQRYDFKNVPVEKLVEHISTIAQTEGITFSHTKLLVKLAELGKGSVRDTLSLFDQVLGLSGNNRITEESFSQALGLAGTTAMKQLVSAMLAGNSKKASEIYLQVVEENIDLKKLCDQVLEAFYRIINSIDDHDLLLRDEVLEPNALQNVTVAELFWIYETLVKDFSWGLSSLNPEKVILIILQKITLRRTILTGDDLKVSEVSQLGKSVAGEDKVEVVVKSSVAKTWNDFLNYLSQTSPATAANISHGNLLGDFDSTLVPLNIEIAFPEEASVFKEYVDERDVYARLKNHLADFFEVDVDRINFRTTLLSSEQKKDKNFKTKVEIDDEIRKNAEEEKRLRILNNPFVKEAEKLFNSRIDKIILKD